MFLIAVIGLSMGLYSLSFFEPEEDILKERPALSSEAIPQYNNKIRDVGETCGYLDGNCKVCLKCVNDRGMLSSEDFKDNGGQGVCEYIPSEQGDGISCPIPIRRCDGQGNCIECFKDEHCGDCSRCVSGIFNIPGQIDKGECFPIETKNEERCSADYYRDGFQGGGFCIHGDCVECLNEGDCPIGLSCEKNLCVY